MEGISGPFVNPRPLSQLLCLELFEEGSSVQEDGGDLVDAGGGVDFSQDFDGEFAHGDRLEVPDVRPEADVVGM